MAMQQEALLAAVKSKPYGKENLARFLARQSHLHLNGKGLDKIDATIMLSCPKLKVLYLFDNAIERVHFGSAGNCLTHLYLQHNHISSFGEVHGLRSLQKLYLDNNRLSSLSSLAALAPSLVELHVSSQRPEDGAPLDEIRIPCPPPGEASVRRRVLTTAHTTVCRAVQCR